LANQLNLKNNYMAKKKKNIKIEKFSLYTFLVIVSVLGSLIIAKIIIAQFHEYIPQTNFYGESGLIKEPKEPIPYNEGDIFRPLFGFFLWISSAFIVAYIINIFKKNFAYNFLKTFGYTTSKNTGDFYKHWFWIWWLIAIPVIWGVVITLFRGLIYFINYQFNTSFEPSSWIFFIIPIWLVFHLIAAYKK